MNTISISDLKINPSKAISFASDYPIAIENRNKVKAYLLGKDLYEKLVSYVEQMIDKQVVEETNFSQGRDFEAVAKKLNI
ncbi:prevent-host-death protein [Candidatus Roizmanbacteria bacterium CG22_combo_CG10-13_8_21_14_all_35_9]|uniref:Prevent-host-death protein n=2 Tax=Candidatus Roizmaniibacteriota TaxID=1752723 RepID=A0A2M8F3K3_9BACT|nr:prevent-host-death protein [Candidatus Falkowbacteria bacterium]PIP62845.1 MAG: prevent-host-death protein [Candidatus Roizmanbacteria bacterium CG22_combo_CG10-13_8_21_14_all_35_9]PJC33869.1 MAG: prevent-host-death protein [Candidatus Roizmanbacteria bacterium CG_4_9_14_0_2_um_filter_35_15]